MEPAQYGSSASTEPQLQVHAGLTLPLEGQERNGGKRARRAAVIRMVGALVCIIGAIAACEHIDMIVCYRMRAISYLYVIHDLLFLTNV